MSWRPACDSAGCVRAPAVCDGAGYQTLLVEREGRENRVESDERPALERGCFAVSGDLPHRQSHHEQRTDVDGREREWERRGEQERDQDQQGKKEGGDLSD